MLKTSIQTLLFCLRDTKYFVTRSYENVSTCSCTETIYLILFLSFWVANNIY
jgi:hypothetical protein